MLSPSVRRAVGRNGTGCAEAGSEASSPFHVRAHPTRSVHDGSGSLVTVLGLLSYDGLSCVSSGLLA
jgi:hypothetical protein